VNDKAIILVVEDNKHMLSANARVLTEAGYEVLTAPDLAAARAHLSKTLPDAIVLDIMLPDGNGLDFIPEIRTVTNAPVLFTTSLGTKDARLAGLQAGDDYIVKPFDYDELCARVGAFLRREAKHRENVGREITHGSLTLDTVSGIAYQNGKDMGLTQKEFAVLLIFAQNKGKIMSAEHIYKRAWGQPMAGDKNTLQATISKLRKKIELSEYTIKMSRNQGYSFEYI